MNTPPVQGACLCGAVRFQVTLPTLFCVHCHCTMCQRNHGAAYVTWFGVPKDQTRIDDFAGVSPDRWPDTTIPVLNVAAVSYTTDRSTDPNQAIVDD